MSTQPVSVSEIAPPQSFTADFLAPALPLIGRGIKVIRLRPQSKIPIDSNWPELATTDEAAVRRWATETPDANCGCVADPRVGGYFFFETDSLDVQERYRSETGEELPITLTVESSPGHFHYYFKHSQYSLQNLGNISQSVVKHNDFSIRVKDQFCVSPGSIHPKTKRFYRIRKNVPMTIVPDGLVNWILAQAETLKMEPTIVGPIIPWGSHDIELTRIAGRLRWSGGGEKLILAGLIEACEDRCPDRGPDYVQMCEKIAHSIAKKAPGDCKEYTAIIGSAAPAPIAIDEYQPATVSVNQDDPEDARMREALEKFRDVPAFDSTVMTGVCKEFVELATRGTTLQPQFVFTGIKAIIGSIMSAKGVKFDVIDDEAPRYVANMGYTGSGKGASLTRIQKIIFNSELLSGAGCDLKLVEAIDSAAGLKDLFFEDPPKAPVLYLCDEVTTLANRTKESRDPGILDLIGELANKTIVTRVLAKRSGGAKQKGDCRLVMLACGPDGEAFTELASGRTTKGLLDRIIPEYGVPVEGGDLPPIPVRDAVVILGKIKNLPYLGKDGKPSTMVMSAEAKAALDQFWKKQPKWVQKKVRFKNGLWLDSYVTAFVDSRLIVTAADAETAIKIFVRQLAIRKAAFTEPTPDRTGHFLALLKQLTEGMARRLADGIPPEVVAMSKRDFADRTHAYRDNEGHKFETAWVVWIKGGYLQKTEFKGANGRVYEKYLPAPEER